MAKSKPTLGTIFKAVVNLHDTVAGLQKQVAELPSKDYVQKVVGDAAENVKEELLKEIRPIAKAVDRDAVTIVKHERRIARIESQLSVR